MKVTLFCRSPLQPQDEQEWVQGPEEAPEVDQLQGKSLWVLLITVGFFAQLDQ